MKPLVAGALIDLPLPRGSVFRCFPWVSSCGSSSRVFWNDGLVPTQELFVRGIRSSFYNEISGSGRDQRAPFVLDFVNKYIQRGCRTNWRAAGPNSETVAKVKAFRFSTGNGAVYKLLIGKKRKRRHCLLIAAMFLWKHRVLIFSGTQRHKKYSVVLRVKYLFWQPYGQGCNSIAWKTKQPLFLFSPPTKKQP